MMQSVLIVREEPGRSSRVNRVVSMTREKAQRMIADGYAVATDKKAEYMDAAKVLADFEKRNNPTAEEPAESKDTPPRARLENLV